MPLASFHRKLKSAIKHAAQAAASFYEAGDVELPEQYIDDLAGVEVKPEPSSPKVMAEHVLSVYRELRSVRKTADQLGLNREKVRRIVSAASMEMNEVEELISDRQGMAMLNRAHLSGDDDVPQDPRDWNVDD
jgi:hypothetical protein